MAEAAGLGLAVASIVLALYDKCKSSALDFHHLAQDLKSFHEALLLTEPYLPHLDNIKIACEELDAEIERLLLKYASRRPWQRVTLSSAEIQPLRARLHYQVATLHLNISILNHREINATQSRASLAVIQPQAPETSRDHLRSWSVDYSSTVSDESFNYFSPVFSENCLPPTSSRSSLSNANSSPVPIKYFGRNKTVPNRLSIQSSISSSSVSTVATEASNYITRSDSRSNDYRSRISEPATEDDLAILSDVWSPYGGKSVDDALRAISSTERGLPIHAQQVQALLRQGATWQYTDSQLLRTPLIWAIISGRKDIVKIFVQERHSVDLRDGRRSRTPAMWAVIEDQPEILELLINASADLGATEPHSGYTALLWAASTGNVRVAEMLLRSDPELIAATDKDGMTPLAISYFDGHLDAARCFIEAKDNPNFKCKYGSPLLAWALRSEHTDIARLLLEHDADAQATDMDNIPVLLLAIQRNLANMVKLLVKKGANVNTVDSNLTPALTLAVKDQRLEIAQILVENGAYLEALDGDANTALLWAIWRNDERIVDLLVAQGANVNVQDGEGRPLREWAS